MVSNSSNFRRYTAFDNLLITIEQCIRTFNSRSPASANPSHNQPAQPLNANEQRQSASLMRINHAGEVCAQALYLGQSFTARNKTTAAAMQKAAEEEIAHLTWCENRINELNAKTSYLNPIWFIGSLAIGITAGIAGDSISLGFLAETENQVVKHLDKHLSLISQNDLKSRAILQQMKIDEQQHATLAVEQGAAELPIVIKFGMSLTSKVMTTLTYHI